MSYPYRKPNLRIDAKEIRAPKREKPSRPNVRIEIARADGVQTVGYFAWNHEPGTDGLSPESTPEALKEEWSKSRLALAPLVGWFHEVEAMRWPELTESHLNLCGDPSTEG
jgi:hypothetical protein